MSVKDLNLEGLVESYKKNDYDVTETRKELGLTYDTFYYRRGQARLAGLLPLTDKEIKHLEENGVDHEHLENNGFSVADYYDACNGDREKAASLMGLRLPEFNERLEFHAKFSGQDNSTEMIEFPTPKGDEVFRYVITSAQNNTYVKEDILENLLAISNYYGAKFIVGTYSYNKGAFVSKKSVKAGKEPTDDDKGELFYDSRIEEYIIDKKVKLQNNLIYCGNMNELPTSPNPLSGLESFTGRSSGIFPHAKFALDSVPSVSKYEPTKFNYTTGTVTKRNYIQKKAGIKAEVYHGYGGLLVEVTKDSFFVRQLQADRFGDIYDVGSKFVIKASGGVVVEFREKGGFINEYNTRTKKSKKTNNVNVVEAVNPGDIHEIYLEDWMRKVFWTDSNSVLKTLKPKYQFFHDVIDFRSRNHHDRHNPILNYRKNLKGIDDVEQEIINYAKFMDESVIDNCETVVVDSNHHNAVMRWLQESKANMDDPKNAYFYIKGWEACLDAIRNNEWEDFNILKWSYERYSNENLNNIKFLREDESFVICKDGSEHDGIECGSHGHLGLNGGRPGKTSFQKLSRGLNLGHSHSCSITGDVWVAGVTGSLSMDYVKGPSSWSQSFIVTHKNGSRQMITIWGGKWKA